MRASRLTSPTWCTARLFGLVAGFACLFVALLMAQDSTAVHDKLGIFGPVADKFWATLGALVASGATWLWARYSNAFRSTSEPVKWAALYGFSLLYNLFASWVGLPTVNPMTEGWGAAALVVAGQGSVAALVYKLAGHQLPPVAPATTRPI